ncbi:MAG: endonuclease V [Anaerolineales bacterium]|nr:endonuclease V [Anaerolineales bacterium]MCS7248698.1 endonuclease V [Anaerolineales bacterium]MDW8162511.1 endonuclease V [Anaerolineales bacterium]MDW8445692.1 endonuclease V [Anaerolineales bacterium]
MTKPLITENRNELYPLHRWDVSLEEAERIQDELRHYVRISSFPAILQASLTAVAAGEYEGNVFAAAVTVDSGKRILESSIEQEKVVFPYRSGYLAFHQAPAILKALTQLSRLGDVMIVSGHGLAHPRRFGLASHLGVLLDFPTIGCARGLLPGNQLHPSENPLIDWVCDTEGVVGIAVYKQRYKKPYVLSIGHRVDTGTLLAFARLWMNDHSTPEPLRLARRLVREQFRKG